MKDKCNSISYKRNAIRLYIKNINDKTFNVILNHILINTSKTETCIPESGQSFNPIGKRYSKTSITF